MIILKLIMPNTGCKVSKYGVSSGPYFPAFGQVSRSVIPSCVSWNSLISQKLSLDYYLAFIILIHTYIHTYKNLVVTHMYFYLDVMTLMTKNQKKNLYPELSIERVSYTYTMKIYSKFMALPYQKIKQTVIETNTNTTQIVRIDEIWYCDATRSEPSLHKLVNLWGK